MSKRLLGGIIGCKNTNLFMAFKLVLLYFLFLFFFVFSLRYWWVRYGSCSCLFYFGGGGISPLATLASPCLMSVYYIIIIYVPFYSYVALDPDPVKRPEKNENQTEKLLFVKAALHR